MWLLIIPPLAVLLALLWTSLKARPARNPRTADSVEGYRRGMAALARIDTAEHPGRGTDS